jgi:signal transduction histidine kinase
MNDPQAEPSPDNAQDLPMQPDIWQQIARERRQLGYDLHDGLLQQIIGAGMLLEALRYRIVGGHIATEKDISTISKIIEGAINEGRVLIRKLERNELEECESLTVLLSRWQAAFQKQTDKIRLHLHIEPSLVDRLSNLPPKVTGHILAIVREASSNILKHSKATEAHVRLQTTPSCSNSIVTSKTPGNTDVLLTIHDNGRGMNIGELWDEDEKDHFGLSSMQHRAEAIGGKFSLRAEPGHGTTIEICFPLQ